MGACYTENLLLAAERVDILRYYFLTKNNESKLQYLGAMELFLVEDFVKVIIFSDHVYIRYIIKP